MKDSGVEWIGEAPTGWGIAKIASLYSLRNDRVSDKEYPPLSVTMHGILPQLGTAARTDDGDNRRLVRVGDFVINSRSDRRGSCGISPYDGSVSLINTVMTSRGKMNAGYYNWLVHTSQFADEFYKWGHGIVDDLWTTRWQEMKRILVPVPQLPEQERIRGYLDSTCADINIAVAEAKASIEEYKLLKQSVITQAVTKGLDLNVPMKDSGVEWIGRIPKTSTIVKLRYLVKDYKAGPFGSSLITDKLLSTGAILVYSPEHVANQSTNRLSNLYLPESRRDEMSHFFVREGEIVFPIVGSLGRAMLITNGMPPGIINQRLAKFSAREEKIDRNYLMWIFGKSSFYSEYIGVHQRGAIIVNLTKTIVGDMPVVLPSTMNDQRKIVAYLDEKCDRIDSLVAEKQATISDLESYKKSLIYEVVTGKRRVA